MPLVRVSNGGTSYKAVFSCFYGNPGNTSPGYTVSFVCKDNPNLNQYYPHSNMMSGSGESSMSVNNDYLTFSRQSMTHSGSLKIKKECDLWLVGQNTGMSGPTHCVGGETFNYNENLYCYQPVCVFY